MTIELNRKQKLRTNLSKIVQLVICMFFVVQNIGIAQGLGVNKKEKEFTKANGPNLLFIMTDQQRFDAMSCAGNTVLETPNMDRLAREGVLFKNAYTANPVCVPSRAIILTGLSSENVNVRGNGDYESKHVPDVPTFDRILKKEGYAAEYYGKWHTPYQFTDCYDNEVNPIGNNHKAPHIIKAYNAWLHSKGITKKEPGEGQLYSSRNLSPYTPVKLDFSYDKKDLDSDEKMAIKAKQVTQFGRVDLPPNVSYASYNTEQTLDALERLKDGPFTLTCSFDPPHPPMVIQEPYYSMYPPESIPVPESMYDSLTNSPYEKKGNAEGELPFKNEENIKQMRSIYYGMVREVDDKIGEILNKLDALGLTENTLVVFTADHGEMLGDHGMHSKNIFYEGSVHVPLIMRFPGRIKAGTKVEEPVSTTDLFSTILDYTGMPVQKSNGISLRPFIEGKPFEHDVVSYASGNNIPNYMLRYGDFKLMISEDDKSTGVNGLYNLKKDPFEMRNLLVSPVSLKKNKQQAEMMKERLVKWLEAHEPDKADKFKNIEL